MAKLMILAALLFVSSKTGISSGGTTTSPQQQIPQTGADKDPCEVILSMLYPRLFSTKSEIHFCSWIFLDSRIEWHTRNAGNSWRHGTARTNRKRWSQGEPCVKGPRGTTGARGEKGNPGSLGKNSAPGMMGVKGNKDDEGSRGSSGPPGIKGVKGEQGSKGEKGEIVNSVVSQINWKQFVWKNLNGNRDSGKFKVQKYLQNAMKNKLSVRKNLSWPSLKETFEKWHETKNIN